MCRSTPRPAGCAGNHPRRLRLRAFLLFAAIAFAAEASAVTLSRIGHGGARTWSQPGTNPCGNLCQPDWALARMRRLMPPEVHDELARRLATSVPAKRYRVATGDRIIAMSYAKGGVPFLEVAERMAQFPPAVRYEALGYSVVHDDFLYRFVRIAACGNWALIVAPLGARPAVVWSEAVGWATAPGIGDVLYGDHSLIGRGGTVPHPQPPFGPWLLQEFPTLVIGSRETPPLPPGIRLRQEIPTSAPLPGAVLLLASGVALRPPAAPAPR